MRMLLQFAEKAALLQLHVKALECAVNRLVGLYGYVDQSSLLPLQRTIMAHFAIKKRVDAPEPRGSEPSF